MVRCATCTEWALACDACAEVNAKDAWERYCLSGHKPAYLPDRPDLVYADSWRGWRDWVRWSTAEPRIRLAFEVAILTGGSLDTALDGG